jgi:hypothetical protein
MHVDGEMSFVGLAISIVGEVICRAVLVVEGVCEEYHLFGILRGWVTGATYISPNLRWIRKHGRSRG